MMNASEHMEEVNLAYQEMRRSTDALRAMEDLIYLITEPVQSVHVCIYRDGEKPCMDIYCRFTNMIRLDKLDKTSRTLCHIPEKARSSFISSDQGCIAHYNVRDVDLVSWFSHPQTLNLSSQGKLQLIQQ